MSPGDLVVADADGVAVVPLAKLDATLDAYLGLKDREARTLEAIGNGGTLAEIYGVPEIIPVEPDSKVSADLQDHMVDLAPSGDGGTACKLSGKVN